jgi:hypothetical protein
VAKSNLRATQLQLIFQKAKVKHFAIILFSIILVKIINHRGFNPANKTLAMCAQNSYEIHIIDESVTRQEILSVEAVTNSHFRSFITSIKHHVLSKFPGAVSCQENLDNKPKIELVFVRLPLVTSENRPIAPAPSPDASRSDVICRLDSPWAKLTVNRAERPLVRGVFIWNERQFLLDQALMAGAQASFGTAPVPFNESVFDKFIQDYTNSVLLAPSPEARNMALTGVAKRLPPEVFWLFRRSPQSTRGPFTGFVMSALSTTIARANPQYTALTKVILNRCFASRRTEERYESVLDLKNLFPIDKYRIDQLY